MLISDRLFSDWMPREIYNEKIWVIGLSGGADSLCLTLLAHDYAALHGIKIIAGIVDHKLRPESSSEILPTIKILNEKGIEHDVMVWEHKDDIEGSIELKARSARYDLLYKLCKTVGSRVLVTAHHALDQWETFFMRLSRGSSIRGLTCIRRVSDFKDVKLFRPLLEATPDDIKQTLKERFNISEYVDDPSNSDDKFERVRWRNAYEELSKYSLDITNISKTIRRIQTANDCIDYMVKSTIADIFDGSRLLIEKFRHLSLEIRMRIIDTIISTVSPKSKRVISYSLLKRTVGEICKREFIATNLSGLVLRRDRKDVDCIVVSAEDRP